MPVLVPSHIVQKCNRRSLCVFCMQVMQLWSNCVQIASIKLYVYSKLSLSVWHFKNQVYKILFSEIHYLYEDSVIVSVISCWYVWFEMCGEILEKNCIYYGTGFVLCHNMQCTLHCSVETVNLSSCTSDLCIHAQL